MTRFLRKLRWLTQRSRKEAELRDELEFHLAEEADEHRAAGLTDPDARFAARRNLGRVASIAEDTRAAWGWPLLEQVAQDLRYAVRTLRRTPVPTLAAIVTLALGIGMTTAIFTVVHGIILRPLPFDEPDRLVVVHTVLDGRFDDDLYVSPPNYMSLREETRAFTDLVAFSTGEATITGIGEARRVEMASVSAPFFELLGVRAAIGRTFDRDANDPGRSRVVVLGHGLWQQLFGGDPTAIGRAIRLDGNPHTVIGVMPARFDFPAERALWTPITYEGTWSATTPLERKRNAWLPSIGRLKPGVTREMAQSDLQAVARALEARFPESNTGVTFMPRNLHDALVGDLRTPLLLLLGAVALVLCIVCANVAGLLLARAASRREEVAVCAALGASRGRLIRQLLTESLVLGIVGGILGLALAFWATDRLLVLSPPTIPRSDTLTVDRILLVYALGVTLLASVLAGLAPALRAAGDAMAGTLRTAGRGSHASRRGRPLRHALVVGQLALAVVLLVGAGLFLRSFQRLTAVDVGVRTERVTTFRLSLPDVDYGSPERIASFYERLLARLEAHPGIHSAAIAFRRPPIGRLSTRFAIEGRTRPGEEPSMAVQPVTPGYFQTMGVPLIRGRLIAETDRRNSPAVIVISATAVQRFFPGEDPVGKRLSNFHYNPVEHAAEPYGNLFTIVGVVADVKNAGLEREAVPEAYFAHAQIPLPRMFVAVRATAGDAASLANDLRRHVAALDPNLPVTELSTLDDVVTNARARPRYFAVLLSLLSGVALTLAAVGIFGLLSFAVAQRTHEIGIRIALGASRGTVVSAIVREAMTLVLVGFGIGVAGALALTRLVATQLFEVSPTDPVAFAGVAVILGATALAASLMPAWRAAGVDPLVALRTE